VDEEFVGGDRTTRLRTFALLGLGLFVLLGARVLSNVLYPSEEALMATDPALAVKRTADRLLMTTFVAAAVLWTSAVHLVRLGIRVTRSGRWPPPGMRMASRTKIRRGKHAVFAWIVLFATAGAFVIAPLVGFQGWYKISRRLAELGVRAQ
jgi:hypothetical protein